jgi:threonine dehydrogenase-like Zn-dependent dehydrogenase
VDAVVDASGVPAAIAAAAPRLRPGGVLVLLGLGDAPIPPVPPGVRVRGSFAFRRAEFDRSAGLIASGRVRLSGAVTHRFGLADVARAIDTAAHDPAAVKVVVAPADDQKETA